MTDLKTKKSGYLELPVLRVSATNIEKVAGVFHQKAIVKTSSEGESIICIRAMFNNDKKESISVELYGYDNDHPADYIYYDITNDGYSAAGLCIRLQSMLSYHFCHNPTQCLSRTLVNDIATVICWLSILLTKGTIPSTEDINKFNVKEWRNIPDDNFDTCEEN